MYTFVYARHKIHSKIEQKHEQWYLLLDTLPKVIDFVEVRSQQLGKSYKYVAEMILGGFKGHFSNRDDATIHTLLACTERQRLSLKDDLSLVLGYATTYLEGFLKGGTLVVGPSNGWRHVDDSFEILARIESKDLVFPTSSEKDIKITKWPNGSHYYASVGNQTVYDSKGNMKWSTEPEAREHAREFLLSRITEVK